jgi:hypothetical protein
MTRRILRPEVHPIEPDYDLPPGVIDGHAPVMLHRSVRLMDDAVAYRVTAVRFARDAGMTFQAIGDLLGLSEARVRQILAAPEIAGQGAVREPDSNTSSTRLGVKENGPELVVSATELGPNQHLYERRG